MTHLSWLIKLRWGAVVTQALLVVVVDRTTVHLPVAWLLAALSAVAITNAALLFWSRRTTNKTNGGATVRPSLLGATLAFDVAVLTAMLAVTGGSLNPFTSLYLVYIALAAVVLDARFIWALVALSAAGFALLFVRTPPMADADHAKHMQIHLKGMWLAFTFSALFIGYFVSRMQRELERVRESKERSEKLAALATLAAGAAHELATPLSTIAVVAKELDLRLRRESADASLVEDAALIREEVLRCRAVLDQLSTDAGQSAGESMTVTRVDDLLADITRGAAVRVSTDGAGDATLRVARRATEMALRGLVKNAIDASSEVVIEAHRRNGKVEIVIADRGQGIDASTLARIGEPFFTTKPPGRGMGLGVFVARSVIEHAGGALRYESGASGTRAIVTLPTA